MTVFVSGVILMFQGRAHRDPMLLIHKVSFIVWVVVFALHVLGHLPEVLACIPGLRGGSSVRELRELRAGLPGMNAPRQHPERARPAASPALADARSHSPSRWSAG